eukprot:CAMPEP_0179087398 /NCGR_PEP_ID=MMETSP0796-20121207/39706_1 /TAXON_ID=73915 /ORGANISM="Pyrodinium bahamense, Strain pbaha01" /LENGTH=291 /DNA_ID=CAMNT_0020784901 /DNA_START=68 /DNA_END=943 /DNA_ORIENTATION=-
MGGLKSDPSEGPVRTFIKGFLTGFIEAVICYPTEFVKTQLQLQSKTNPEYKGMLDCASKTVKTSGVMGLYRGAAPLIVGSSFKQSARWSGYQAAVNQLKDEQGNLTIPRRMCAGLVGGVSEAVFAVTPMETIKTRVTDDVRRGTGNYSGSLDACIKIMKSEGPGGLYRGVIPTIAKQGTNQMVRFPVQHLCMQAMVGGDKQAMKNPLYNGIAGAVAGAVSVILTMPQDTVKTRMQGEEAKKLYKGTVDCAMQIFRKEGPAFFFSGTLPRMVRVSLDVGITFCIFPLLSKYI